MNGDRRPLVEVVYEGTNPIQVLVDGITYEVVQEESLLEVIAEDGVTAIPARSENGWTIIVTIFLSDFGKQYIVPSERFREVWDLCFERGVVTFYAVDWDNFEFWYTFQPSVKKEWEYPSYEEHVIDPEDGPL